MTTRKPRVKSEDVPPYAAGGFLGSLTPDERATIAAALAILDSRVRGEKLSAPTEASDYLKLKLSGRMSEGFYCLFLDTTHRVLELACLFEGTIDGCEVHPREVARRALELNAAAVILAHNHPSGNPEPSAADRAVTARLKQSLALLDVRVLDHIIVGDGMPCSMAQRGMI